MFGNDGKTGGAASGSVTILGPRASVTGDIAFSGYLRVQGKVLGNVSCNNDTQGTTVVHGAGSIAGAVASPNIVVGGTIDGHVTATESIEIHSGAHVTGDARYRQISVQQGGIIEGALIPTVPEGDHHRLERRVSVASSPAVKELDIPLPANRRASDKFRVGKGFRVLLAVVAVLAVVWLLRSRHEETPMPADSPAVEAPVSNVPAPVATPSEPVVAPGEQKKPVIALRPEPEAPPAKPVEAPSVKPPEAAGALLPDTGEVVTVQGAEIGKPTDAFFVNTREPAVMFKKSIDANGDGTRIELAQGAKRRFTIADSEVVRIAKGEAVEVFYQGRKVSPAFIRRGVWMRFVPLEE